MYNGTVKRKKAERRPTVDCGENTKMGNGMRGNTTLLTVQGSRCLLLFDATSAVMSASKTNGSPYNKVVRSTATACATARETCSGPFSSKAMPLERNNYRVGRTLTTYYYTTVCDILYNVEKMVDFVVYGYVSG